MTHSDRSGDDSGASCRSCHKTELAEDDMCQEAQIKCMVFKILEPVWTSLTQLLIRQLASHHMSTDQEVFLCESFSLWQSLISVRANLSFVESRGLSSDLGSCLTQLSDTTPGSTCGFTLKFSFYKLLIFRFGVEISTRCSVRVFVLWNNSGSSEYTTPGAV